MRSYEQFCAIAKALDVVGDRWTLLIVRELLLRGPSRYTDLRDGLPGIATNLLADRLRDLEQAGLVRRMAARPPVATDLFSLSERGAALAPVLEALGQWGGPLLAGQARGDAFRSHWLAFPLGLHLADHSPERPPVTLEVRSGGEPLLVETVGDGSVRARAGTAEHPDAVITGPPDVVVRLLLGRFTLAQARARGVSFQGRAAVLRRVRPREQPAATAG